MLYPRLLLPGLVIGMAAVIGLLVVSANGMLGGTPAPFQPQATTATSTATPTATATPLPQDVFFSLATGNPSGLDPADILGPGPVVSIGCAALGLICGAAGSGGPPAQDDIDAFSFVFEKLGNQVVYFSTDSTSVGVAGSGTAAHSNAAGGACHEEGDEYAQAPGNTNVVFIPAVALGLIEAGCPDAANDDDDVDGLAWGPAPGAGGTVVYSLAPNSPTLAPGGPLGPAGGSPADIIFSKVNGPGPRVGIPAANLGLAAADDIDALCVFANGSILFSLAPGSPALAGIPATQEDLLVTVIIGGQPKAIVWKLGIVYGLLPAPPPPGDNLDAVKCQEPANPEEPIPTITSTATATPTGVATATSTATPTATPTSTPTSTPTPTPTPTSTPTATPFLTCPLPEPSPLFSCIGIRLLAFSLEAETDELLGPEIGIVKQERITHDPQVGQVLHFQWFPPPGTTWHCNRANVPPEEGQNVQCTVSALAAGSGDPNAPADAQADCDALPDGGGGNPWQFDAELFKCKKVVPDSTIVAATAPTSPDVINTCAVSEGIGGAPNPYVISDCDLDYEKTLPAGTPSTITAPGVPNFQQHQPWKKVVNQSEPGSHSYEECVVIQPEPPVTDPDQSDNSDCITVTISQPVGGIAEVRVDRSDSPTSTTGGSTSLPYVAISAGIAAAVVAVAAAASYVRRRRLLR